MIRFTVCSGFWKKSIYNNTSPYVYLLRRSTLHQKEEGGREGGRTERKKERKEEKKERKKEGRTYIRKRGGGRLIVKIFAPIGAVEE